MAAVRFLQISNFRGIASLEWAPYPGFNAIIGPGDSAKSTILDAIDLVLGTRRGSFTEVDFYRLNTNDPIFIDVTVGDLPPEILDLEVYSSAIRGWDSFLQVVEDEPKVDSDEPVITLRLTVTADCEPTWCLYSERLEALSLPRDVRATHRAMISAVRLGTFAAQHLAWGPRSVLSRLSEGDEESAAVLATVTKAARSNFDASQISELKPAIEAAKRVAQDMAVFGGLTARAALDPRAVSIGSGAVALHDRNSVPLRSLGLGSSRLMAAGLQATAAAKIPVVLFDEIEQGLEPHRITRLLQHLGSKSRSPTQQVFLTTHSPCVLRELSASQLWKAGLSRRGMLELSMMPREIQGTLRAHSEAFLSPSVLVGEGATECGIVRGLDIYDAEKGLETLALNGIAVVDGGGTPKAQAVAVQFAKLGFRTGLLRDSDKISRKDEEELLSLGGKIFCWEDGLTTEDQIFRSLPLSSFHHLLEIADTYRTKSRVDAHLSSQGLNKDDIAALRKSPTDDHRTVLASAARSGEWFKRTDIAEDVGRIVIGPYVDRSTGGLSPALRALAKWAANDP